MTEQLDLIIEDSASKNGVLRYLVEFDRSAEAAKHAAIDRVERHQDETHLALAKQAVLAVASRFEDFTTDQVQEALPEAAEWFSDTRAWGAVMRCLAKEGRIEKTGEYRPSTQVACHGRDKAVWRAVTQS